MEQESHNKDEDEISLIDLFAVLLKYRWLIAAVTCLGIVAGCIWYLTQRHAQRQTTMSPASQTGEALGRMIITCNPKIMPQGFNYIYERPIQVFSRPDLVYEACIEAGIKSLTAWGTTVSLENKAQALYFISWLVKSTDINGKYQSSGQTFLAVDYGYQVELDFQYTDPAKVSTFLNVLFKLGNEAVSNGYKLYAEDVVANAQDYLSSSNASDKATLRFAKAFLAGKEPILEKLYEPIVGINPNFSSINSGSKFQSPKLRFIIIVFVFFIFSIFLAFFNNWFKDLKADPVVKQKLREALGKNKFD